MLKLICGPWTTYCRNIKIEVNSSRACWLVNDGRDDLIDRGYKLEFDKYPLIIEELKSETSSASIECGLSTS